jgi:hypothetical protein
MKGTNHEKRIQNNEKLINSRRRKIDEGEFILKRKSSEIFIPFFDISGQARPE